MAEKGTQIAPSQLKKFSISEDNNKVGECRTQRARSQRKGKGGREEGIGRRRGAAVQRFQNEDRGKPI
jgi:hypothetical protein